MAQHTIASERNSIDCEQLVPAMDSIRDGFRGGKCDPVAPRIDKEEGRVDTLTANHVRQVSNLVEQRDREKRGQQAKEEYGTSSGHGLRVLLGGQS
jgi:hypothetical protein